MKHLLILIVALNISISGMSQKGNVTSALGYIDQGVLDKAKEAIDHAFDNEKTKNWANTFFAKAKLCQAVYESTDPKYKSFYTDPLCEAYNAYEKAIELDPKGSIKKKIITKMIYSSLALDLFNQGTTQFESKDYEGALKSLELQIKISESDKFVGETDTGLYYNAGLAAINSGNHKKAISYFEKCTEMKYLGITPYYQIYECYLGLGDTSKAESVLKDLPKMFPSDKTITLQLIDLYIKCKKTEEAQEYIKVAKVEDPTNSSLYFAAGIMYLNENKYDEAIDDLSKSIELNPDVYDAQYGLGAAYINKASEMFVKANNIKDIKKYTEAIEVANAVYSKALPHMEKAHYLNPQDVYALRGLQELYYRLKETDKYSAIKALIDKIDY
jgi:tetratricopeptide (TPR) repeat protein